MEKSIADINQVHRNLISFVIRRYRRFYNSFYKPQQYKSCDLPVVKLDSLFFPFNSNKKHTLQENITTLNLVNADTSWKKIVKTDGHYFRLPKSYPNETPLQ